MQIPFHLCLTSLRFLNEKLNDFHAKMFAKMVEDTYVCGSFSKFRTTCPSWRIWQVHHRRVTIAAWKGDQSNKLPTFGKGRSFVNWSDGLFINSRRMCRRPLTDAQRNRPSLGRRQRQSERLWAMSLQPRRQIPGVQSTNLTFPNFVSFQRFRTAPFHFFSHIHFTTFTWAHSKVPLFLRNVPQPSPRQCHCV